MAAARWFNATFNRMMVLAVGGTLERRLDRAERVGEDAYLSFGGSNRAAEKMKIERWGHQF
jgi:hypothetical protein